MIVQYVLYLRPFIMSNRYNEFIRRTLTIIPCQVCEELVVVKEYHRHLSLKHPEVFIATKKLCIWCLDYAWRKGIDNIGHRFLCLKRRLGLKRVVEEGASSSRVQDTVVASTSSLPPTQLLVSSMYPQISSSRPKIDFTGMDLTRYLNCDECNTWYENERVPGPFVKPFSSIDDSCGLDIPIDVEWLERDLPEYVDIDYRNIGAAGRKRIKLHEEEKIIISRLEKLQMDPESGIDGYWMRLYLSQGRELAWFHYSIRHQVWKKFYDAASVNTKSFCVMPYWCMCSGGDLVSDEFHHRHIIVVCERNNVWYLKKIMSTVTFDDGKLCCINSRGRKMDSKYHKEINTVKHFMNTWRYVSSPSSMCANKEIVVEGINQARNENTFHGAKVFVSGKKRGASVTGKCHYYIRRPMIPHCFLGMAMYFPDGFQTITEIMKMNVSVSKFKHISRSADGKWRVLLKDVYGDIQNHIFPTCKALRLDLEDAVQQQSAAANVENLDLVGDVNQFIYVGSLGIKRFSLDPTQMELSRVEYNRSSIGRGNAFVDMLVDAQYLVNRTQQQILDEVHDVRAELLEMLRTKDRIIEEKDRIIKEKDHIIEEIRMDMKRKDKIIERGFKLGNL